MEPPHLELDEAALNAAVKAMHDAQLKQQQLTAETITKVLVDLPDDERVALIKRVEEYRQKQRQQRMKLEMQRQLQGRTEGDWLTGT